VTVDERAMMRRRYADRMDAEWTRTVLASIRRHVAQVGCNLTFGGPKRHHLYITAGRCTRCG
jgi:hypothetical protein